MARYRNEVFIRNELFISNEANVSGIGEAFILKEN